jgi:hypothetical protein
MTGLDDHEKSSRPQHHWRGEDVSSRPLKLALLAAAIICVIALIVYLKARHRPPALHDMLQSLPVNRPAPGSLRAEMLAVPLPSANRKG